MKLLRETVRKLILEDKAAFLADMETAWPEDLQGVEDDEYGYMTARRDGRSVKTAWAQHVDREWVNDMIYVHYMDPYDIIHGNPLNYFGGGWKKGKKTNEISCEAFKSKHQVKPYSNHGEIGLIIKGHVTLLGNSEDLMFTGSTSGYKQQFPKAWKQLGINKGVLRRQADTYVLGAEDYRMPRDGECNEALLDNWEVVAVIAEREGTRRELKNRLHNVYDFTHVPIISIEDTDLNQFKNNR